MLVVNGPSDDGTDEFLAGRTDLRAYKNPQANLSISRNIAIANAAAPFVAFIDDDAIPEADWLGNVMAAFDADAGLDAVGGFIRDANGMSFQAQYTFCDAFGDSYPCENPDYATFLSREKRVYPSLTGTNVVFRKTSLEQIGGFDEVFAYYLDETDVNKRMDDAGMRMSVVPSAEIHHKYAPSHLRQSPRVPTDMVPMARSISYFALRHGAPEFGWGAAGKRLKDYYHSEFKWKSLMVADGVIEERQFDALMHQVRRGLLEGIDCHFDAAAPDATPQRRVLRHVDPATPPVVRQMRADRDVLRLCLFSRDHAHENFGGIGRWTNLVARGLVERGHEVTQIGELAEGQTQQYCDFTEGGYWSHVVGYHGREAGRELDCLGLPADLAQRSMRKRSEMLRIMPRRQFQVASTPIWDVEGAAVIAQRDVPTVVSLHTCAGLMLQSKPDWRADEQFYKYHVLRVINAEIQALRRADVILGNSSAIMRDISQMYGLDLFDRPHHIVPHGITDINEPADLLAQRDTTDGPVRILYLGRLEARKGIDHLVPVLMQLLGARADVVVDLVGGRVDDACLALVQQLVQAYPERVIWHDHLDDAGVDALMRQADVFFAPSLYESFGLIYVEAMRYSVPSVAYAAGGVSEVVTDGTDGLLAPLGDQQALLHALDTIVGDAELRRRLSRGARQTFEAKFHYALMAERLEAVYREAAQMNGAD